MTEQRRGRLEVEVGFCTERGPREENEDYVGVFQGGPDQLARFGVVAAVADGVGGHKGGRVAAELGVRGFIDGHLGQSEALGVRRTSARSIEAVNAWIHAHGRQDPALEGMACTLTALVLRGRQAHVAHVGDSRLYRLRGDRLDRLTLDHTWKQPGMRNVLQRAVGAADGVQVDYAAEAASVHDRYLLCSDGVHAYVSDGALREELLRRASPQETARAVVAAATAARTADNATALVLDVLDLAPANRLDLELEIAAQPIISPPAAGVTVDGFALDAVLSDGRYSRVFRGRDTVEGSEVILKFPKPVTGAEEALRQAFLRETWITARVRSPWVGGMIDVGPERRTCLYSVLPYYAGETMEERLGRPPRVPLAEGLDMSVKLARGVAALHRAGIVHRDIKPENVIIERHESGKIGVRLIDLGVARLPNVDDFGPEHGPGTPSYMAPELFSGGAGDERSDQFALGVTVYRLFTGAYPYGEIEPFTKPRFGQPQPLHVRRPDLPAWLNQALERALAANPADRYGDVLELAFELEHGAIRAAPVLPGRRPLYARNPLLFWQAVSALLALMVIVLLALR